MGPRQLPPDIARNGCNVEEPDRPVQWAAARHDAPGHLGWCCNPEQRSAVSQQGLEATLYKMREAGVDGSAIGVFSHYYRLLESGEMIEIGRASCRERV